MHKDDNIISLLKESISYALKAAKPETCLPPYIPSPPENGKTIVIGAGKASAEMARVFENNYEGDYEGIVVTRYGFSVPTRKIKVMEAAHPNPDPSCIKAVDAIFDLIEKADENDLIICLLSGGGSSLLSAPIDGIEFEDILEINKQLLYSGADITEINTVRKHLNKALGGKLALHAANRKILTLAISDVAGDIPSFIASGPTVADDTTLEMCRSILKKHEIVISQRVLNALGDPLNETPKKNNPIFKNKEYALIATPSKTIHAAQQFWNSNGFETHVIGTKICGDTNDIAKQHVDFAQKLKHMSDKPVAILSGGETTVKLTGNGKGGPNTQYALQAALSLNRTKKIYVMAYDTDGIDGSENNGGAIATPDTLTRAKKLKMDAAQFLQNNDSYSFFKALDDLVITGPTQTNVNDYRVILIL